MTTSFYVYTGIILALAAFNLLEAKAQKPSRGRTFSLWINGVASVLIATAVIISLLTE